MVVAAHPDDEVIGMGGIFRRFSDITSIQMTTGAPANVAFANAHGFGTSVEYAAARRVELVRALRLGGIQDERMLHLDLPDQELMQNIVFATNELARFFEAISPDTVITHSYEGGHQDHDATAFAVEAACKLLVSRKINPPTVIEFTSYHANSNSHMVTGRFLQKDGPTQVTVKLSAAECELKRRMFLCFETQRTVLKLFNIGAETFRRSPKYNFTQPPTAGPILYERLWKISRNISTDLAIKAIKSLGIADINF